MHLQLERWASPMCPLLIVTDDDGILRALEFGDHESRMDRLLCEHYGHYTLEEGPAPVSVTRALQAYFDGNLDAFGEIRIATGVACVGNPRHDVAHALNARGSQLSQLRFE